MFMKENCENYKKIIAAGAIPQLLALSSNPTLILTRNAENIVTADATNRAGQ